MKDILQLLLYLTGRYRWQHIFGFEEGNYRLDLYGKSLKDDYWNYISAVTTNGELRLIKDGKLIYTSNREFINGDGV